MKHKLITIICLALIAPVLFACSAKESMVRTELTYEEALEIHTATGKDYDNFETTLIATATYKDTKFIKAQVKKKGKELLYNSARVSMELTKAERENEFSVNFFVSLYTPDDRYADYSKSKGLWKFYLKKDNYELIEANRIKKISKSGLPGYELLYPYVSPWGHCYEVSFKRNDIRRATGSREILRPLSLVIAGQLGNVELLFD